MQDLCSHQQDKVVLSSTFQKNIFSQSELCQEPPSQWQKAKVEPYTLAILNLVRCQIPLISTRKTQLTPSVSNNLLAVITKAEVSANNHKYWRSWLLSSTGHCFCKVMVIKECHWWLRQGKDQSYLQEQGGGSEAPQHGKTHLDLLEGDVVKQLLKTFSKHRKPRWEQFAQIYGREVTRTKQHYEQYEMRQELMCPPHLQRGFW